MADYTIGSTNPSGASDGNGTGIGADSVWLTKRTLAGASAGATWTALRAWISGGTGGVVRLAIYSDSSNSPNTLLGGGEVTVAASAAAAEYTVTLPGTAAATNGSYWVGFQFGSGSAPAPWYATSGGTMAYGSYPYGAGLPSPYIEDGVNGVNDIRVAADATLAAGTTNTKAGYSTAAGGGSGAKVAGPTTSTKAGRGVAGLAAAAVVISPYEEPTGFFSIAFDAPPMTANPHWTKIDTLEGCRVRDWTIDRGRPNEFAKTDVGTAVVRLVDREGLFDPTNTTSPYYGKVLPGKQAAIALRNPVTDVWWTLFRGYIEAWHYRLDPTEQYMELELQLVDGFAILSRAELRVGIDGALPPYAGDEEGILAEFAAGNVLYGETGGSVHDRINAILDDVTWPPALRENGVDIFSGNVRVGPKAYGPGTSALDALWDAADAEFPGVGNMFIGGPTAPGHFIFRGRQARFRPDVAQYKIQRRTVGDPSAFTLDEDVVPVAELEWSTGHDNLFNSCSATPQGIGSGLSWRPLDPEVDDIPGQLVKAGDPGVGGDPDSIAKHGLRSLTFDNLQTIRGTAGAGTDALEETKKFATFYVENFSTAAPRVSRMVFKTRRPEDPNGEALWNHLCKCEISDLLTLQTEHPGGGGFDDQFYVEGIHYTGRPGPPEYPIVELALDVSPRSHYTSNPWDEDTDP